MKKKEYDSKLKEIEEAMKLFPKEVKRQERAWREEMKVRKAFGKLDLGLKKGKKKSKSSD